MSILLTDDIDSACHHLGLQWSQRRIALPSGLASLARELSGASESAFEFHGVQVGGDPSFLANWDLLVSARSIHKSQFDQLVDWCREDGNSNRWRIACFAEEGTGFHGQRERVWQALLGNIHFSCLLPIDANLTAAQPALSAAPAVGTIRALQRVSPMLRPSIKWVNDIRIGPRKIAGSLIQTVSGPNGVFNLIIGIGVNVKRPPSVAPTPFCPAVTCLQDEVSLESNAGVAIDAVARRLAEECYLAGRRLETDALGLAREYQSYSDLIGRRACLWPTGTLDWRSVAPIARGRIIAIDDQLRLLLDTENEPISTGRLALDDDASP